MVSTFRILVLLLLLSYSASAQNTELQYQNYIASGSSHDMGLQLYWKIFGKNPHIITGIEYRSIDWGSQAGLIFGYSSTLSERGRHTLMGQAKAFLDVALFRPTIMFAPGVSYDLTYRWYTNKRLYFLFAAGARYNYCVGYEKYGRNKQAEVPLSIGFGWTPKTDHSHF